MKYLLFYNDELYDETEYTQEYRKALFGAKPLIYSKGYLYQPAYRHTQWFRCDLTPVLIEEVPTNLRLLARLLTGQS